MNPHDSTLQPRLAGRRARRRPLVSLTPLIDVVFILLVFFMLASSFLDWRAIDLSAPAQASAAGTLEGALLVEVRASDLRVGGETVDADELDRRVGARLEAAPETRVLVRPAPGVDLQRVVSVLDELAAMQPQDLSLIRRNTP
ncbi:biopolymer transporter ExbD [Aquisalimonas lutea]|uniref:ExbD/TolR family protein n=1 Tax=Aquisalimonas lutea TaxID=1327750 RepID=UPI0025B59B49|nr:biopolymer transporter ExbD [Aquisalimonas lutea]MDN3516666.1 biopolymer transporter ExbD [Aquisalimonas lutea]